MTDKFVEPGASAPVAGKDPLGWLLDEKRDQVVIRHGTLAEIYWNDPVAKDGMVKVYSRDKWSDAFVLWSPAGTYMVTVHGKGVQLWSEADWEKPVARLPHDGVKVVEFSPCERYVVTYDKDSKLDAQASIKIWEISTGELLAGYGPRPLLGAGAEQGGAAAASAAGDNGWARFKWSSSGTHFARMSEDPKTVGKEAALSDQEALVFLAREDGGPEAPKSKYSDAKGAREQDASWGDTPEAIAAQKAREAYQKHKERHQQIVSTIGTYPSLLKKAVAWLQEDPRRSPADFLRNVSRDLTLSVYEAPSMEPSGKKLKLANLRDFAWSPGTEPKDASRLAYWAGELKEEGKPANVCLMDWATGATLSQKQMFDVLDCEMFWHPQGHFLALRARRLQKKVPVTTFEIFRVRAKDVPVETVEFKDPVHSFAWEPNNGMRFAVIHGPVARPSVSIYTMGGDRTPAGRAKGKKVDKIRTLEGRNCNTIVWSPLGSQFVLVSMGAGGGSGVVEFWDADNLDSKMGEAEQYNISDVEWDPTGRFVATAVSSIVRHTLDSGFSVFTFYGKPVSVFKSRGDSKFYQLLWRPRPKSLLTDTEEAELITNGINSFSERYDKDDSEAIETAEAGNLEEMQKIRDDFIAAQQAWAKKWKAEKKDRARVRRSNKLSDDEADLVTTTVTVEELLDLKEDIVDLKN
jgi:uncharacterized protein with WD repeat